MSRRNIVLAICLSLLVLFAFGGAVVAQGNVLEDGHVLAAVRALRAKCDGYKYEVVDDTVREAVLNHLRQRGAKVPQQMPTKKQLQGNLVGDFDAQWNDLMSGITSNLDPDGKMELAENLKDYVTEHPSVKNATIKKYNAALTDDLPKVLDRVEQKLVDDQSATLTAALQKVLEVEPKVLSQELVCGAAAGATAKAENALTTAVTERLPKEDQQVLLERAFSMLASESQEIVKDGITQLQEQRDVFKEATAVSKPGLAGEFTRSLEGKARDQQRQRASNPLRLSYGVFSNVKNAMGGEVERWFGNRVADASKMVLGQLENGQRVHSAEDSATIKQSILNDPQTHHTLNGSRKALKLQVQKMVVEKQSWIGDSLVSDLQRSEQDEDETYAEATLRQDVQSVLAVSGSDAYKVWMKIDGFLTRSYEIVLLPKLRENIALDQARQYAPELADGNWRPQEDDVKDLREKLTEPMLKTLPVGNQLPKVRTEVLDETWTIWMQNARKSIAVFKKVQTDQLAIVNELREPMKIWMATEAAQVPNACFQEYVARATQKWKDRGGDRLTDYPDLLKSTRETIRGIIIELLDEVGKEEELKRQVEQKRLQEMQQKDIVVVDPTPEPSVPAEVKMPADESPKEDEGGASGDGEGGNDQPGTGGPGGEAEGNGAGEGPGGDEPGQGDADEEEMPAEEEEQPGDVAEEEPLPAEEVEPVEEIVLPPLEPYEESWSDMCYRIGFWVLLALIVIITCCWYGHVRVLMRQIALLEFREV